jgi:hypothetical protein
MLTYADVCLSPYLAPSDPSPHVASRDSEEEEEEEGAGGGEEEEGEDGKDMHDDFRKKEKGGDKNKNGKTDEKNAGGTLPKNSSEELLGAQLTRFTSTAAQILPLKSAAGATTSLDARYM